MWMMWMMMVVWPQWTRWVERAVRTCSRTRRRRLSSPNWRTMFTKSIKERHLKRKESWMDLRPSTRIYDFNFFSLLIIPLKQSYCCKNNTLRRPRPSQITETAQWFTEMTPLDQLFIRCLNCRGKELEGWIPTPYVFSTSNPLSNYVLGSQLYDSHHIHHFG